MKTGIKVFTKGDYGKRGSFDAERLKELVSNSAEKVKAQFVHSSHWKKLNESKNKKLEPIPIGEFSNFQVKDDSIYADMDFNEIGQTFYDSGIIDKLSAEIDHNSNSFSSIAGLPLGVNGQIEGAEFEADSFAVEFEEDVNFKEMTLERKLEIIKELAESIDREHRDTFRAIMYEFEEEGEKTTMTLKEQLSKATEEEKKEVFEILGAEFEIKPEPKTEEEIRTELTKEFELKAKEDSLKAKLDKLPPSIRGIAEFAIEKACTPSESELTYEFEEGGKKVEKTKISEFEEMLDNLKGIPNGNLTAEFGKVNNGEKTQEDYKKIAEGLSE